VTIRLDREASVRFADIISQLKKAGLVDVQAHERLMIVSGSASYLDLEALRSVPGVLSVREDTSYRAL
jgi:hypothetical protein